MTKDFLTHHAHRVVVVDRSSSSSSSSSSNGAAKSSPVSSCLCFRLKQNLSIFLSVSFSCIFENLQKYDLLFSLFLGGGGCFLYLFLLS